MGIFDAFKKYECSVCGNKVKEKNTAVFLSRDNVYLCKECDRNFSSYCIKYIDKSKIPFYKKHIFSGTELYKDIFSYDLHFGSMFIDTKNGLFSCGQEYIAGQNPIFRLNDFEMLIKFEPQKLNYSRANYNVKGSYVAELYFKDGRINKFFYLSVPISGIYKTKAHSYVYHSYRNVSLPTDEDIRKIDAEVRKSWLSFFTSIAVFFVSLMFSIFNEETARNDNRRIKYTYKTKSQSSNSNSKINYDTNRYKPEEFYCLCFDHECENIKEVADVIHIYLKTVDDNTYNDLCTKLSQGYWSEYYSGYWVLHTGMPIFIKYETFIKQYLLINSAFDRTNRENENEVTACTRLDDAFVYCLLYCSENADNFFGGYDGVEHDGKYYIQREKEMYIERLKTIWEQNSNEQTNRMTEILMDMVSDVRRQINNERNGLPPDYIPKKKKGLLNRLFGKDKKK